MLEEKHQGRVELHFPGDDVAQEARGGIGKARRDAREDDRVPNPRPLKTVKTQKGATDTMRGLTKGSIKAGSSGATKRCVVVGDTFPTWLFHAAGMGYRVEQIAVRDARYKHIMYAIGGEDLGIWSGPDWSSISMWPSVNKEVICFVDGRVTSQLLALLGGIGVAEVISTQRPRKTWAGWNDCSVVVRHEEVGGVTLKAVTIVRHSRSSLAGFPHPLKPAVPRDASTVLSQSSYGHYFRAQPRSIFLETLSCLNLGSEVHPHYHGFGWLPSILDSSVRVLIPARRSSQFRGRWALRHLTGVEVLGCKDVSESHIALVTPEHGDNKFLRLLLPGKCLIAGFEAIFNVGGCEGVISSPPVMQVEESSLANNLEFDTECSRGAAKKVNDLDRKRKDLPLDIEMGSISREKRERIAAKADDAEVPESICGLSTCLMMGPGIGLRNTG
jgi:hypothetical protein